MTRVPDWLPGLVLFADHDGDWDRYLTAIYAIFRRDFVENKPAFKGRRLGLKRHPIDEGKEATFWHMISEGAQETERTPDFRRCERISWPKPIIGNTDDQCVKYWVSVKKGEDRIHIWLQDEDYVVVLADRKTYILPWTAFLVDRQHTREKLSKEHRRYWKEQK